MPFYWLIGLTLAAVAALLYVARTRGNGADRFERLVALCHGDRAMAERLVAGEARRSPDATRRSHVERAIHRLASDRRR